MTKDEVVALLETCQSSSDWNNACDKIKAACKGYPDFWWQDVIQSGLADNIMSRWGGDTRIRIKGF